MIKKTIKYHDFEGNEREDDFYFHLTEIEMGKIDSDPSLPGGLEESINRVRKTGDKGEMLRIIDLIISRAYGVRLPDGGFVKRNVSGLPLYELFVNTEAYDTLLEELITSDQEGIVDFMTGCLTEKARARVREEWNKQKAAGDSQTQAVIAPVK